MKKVTRNDMPCGFSRRKPPIEIDRQRADSIHNPSKTEHEHAIAALARMKELERKHRNKMVTARLDSRTVVSSISKKRLVEIQKSIEKNR